MIRDRFRRLAAVARAVWAGLDPAWPRPDEVLVLRAPAPQVAAVRADLRALGLWPKLPSGALVLVLPTEVQVAVEPRLKPNEDLGYRETANQQVDAGVDGEKGKHICGAPGPGAAA